MLISLGDGPWAKFLHFPTGLLEKNYTTAHLSKVPLRDFLHRPTFFTAKKMLKRG